MPLFTRENAAIMSARGNAVRWSRPKPPAEIPAIPAALPQPVPDNGFQARRLNRVRDQLNLVDCAIEKEGQKAQPDGQRLNWLAQAQDRLAEQERILAGRPLPGSRRPKDHDPKDAHPGAWLEEEPAAPAAPQPKPLGWEYDNPSPSPKGEA